MIYVEQTFLIDLFFPTKNFDRIIKKQEDFKKEYCHVAILHNPDSQQPSKSSQLAKANFPLISPVLNVEKQKLQEIFFQSRLLPGCLQGSG